MAWYREYYAPSVPKKVKGGIKAQSKRGGFGQSWWAKRWITVLESFNLGGRLTRGRSYARSGQVVSIEIGKGKIAAKVQGSSRKPYSVTIKVKTLTKQEWGKVVDALSQSAAFSAALLAGQMPEDIESVFNNAEVSLFPSKTGDLDTNCSCPDWSNPCKHIAAVYYLVGEEFDRDPFLIFKLRGMDQDVLLESLRGAEEPEAPADDTEEALSFDPEEFWQEKLSERLEFGQVEIPRVSAALPRRLGGFPFWRGNAEFLDTLGRTYAKASERGLDAFLETGAAS